MRLSHTIARENFWIALNELLEEARTIANDRRLKDKQFGTVRSYVASFGKSIVGYYDTIKAGIDDDEDPGLKEGAWKAFRGTVLMAEKVNKNNLARLDIKYESSYKAANQWATSIRLNRKRVSFDMLRGGRSLEKLRDPIAFGEWIIGLRGEHYVLRSKAIAEGVKKYQQDLQLTDAERDRWTAMVYFTGGMAALEEFNLFAFGDFMMSLKLLMHTSVVENRQQYIHELLGMISTMRMAADRVSNKWRMGSVDVARFLSLNIRATSSKHDRLAEERKVHFRNLASEDLKLILVPKPIRLWTNSMTIYIETTLVDEHIRFWQWTSKAQWQMDEVDEHIIKEVEEWHSGQWLAEHIANIEKTDNFDAPSNLVLAHASLDPRTTNVKFARDCLINSLGALRSDRTSLGVPAVVEFYECCSKLFEATGYAAAALRSHDRIEKVYRMSNDTRNLEFMRRKEDERIGTIAGTATETLGPQDMKELLDEIKQPTLIGRLMP